MKNLLLSDIQTAKDALKEKIKKANLSIDKLDKKFLQERSAIVKRMTAMINEKFRDKIFVSLHNNGYTVGLSTLRRAVSTKNVLITFRQTGSIEVLYRVTNDLNNNISLDDLRSRIGNIVKPEIRQTSKKGLTVEQLFAEVSDIQEYLLSLKHPVKEQYISSF
ncbi:MAG: hypothetical protein WC564_04345 [Patescibacteria group bacterium]